MSREGWGLSWSTVLGLGPGGIFCEQGQAVFLQDVFLEGVTGLQQPRLGFPGIGTLKDLPGDPAWRYDRSQYICLQNRRTEQREAR